jgi:hypothetical protein
MSYVAEQQPESASVGLGRETEKEVIRLLVVFGSSGKQNEQHLPLKYSSN